MRHLKTLLLLGVAATLVGACSGGGGGSGVMNVEGAYGITYNRVSGSCGGTLNPTWVQGILTVDQMGTSLIFDFGGTDHSMFAILDAAGNYEFDEDLTDSTGLTHVHGLGVFTETSITSADPVSPNSQTAGISASYDTTGDGAADCVVHGRYSGNRTIPTSGP